MNKELDMEQQILQAAEELGLQQGFDATSTIEIARKVGCNQALVHYYFRTKENLFQQVFQRNIERTLSTLTKYEYKGDFEQLLRDWIDSYFATVSERRKVPFFLIKEMLMNDERRAYVRNLIVNNQQRSQLFLSLDAIVQEEVATGRIRPISTLDLFINVMSLSLGTFLALPVYADWLQKDESGIQEFIKHRKEEIIQVLLLSLKK